MLSLRLKDGRPQTYLTPLRVLFESTILRFFETIVFRCLAQKKRHIYHSCMSKSETLALASPAPSSSMPSEDEIIRAFEVPSHREEEVGLPTPLTLRASAPMIGRRGASRIVCCRPSTSHRAGHTVQRRIASARSVSLSTVWKTSQACLRVLQPPPSFLVDVGVCCSMSWAPVA